MASISGGESDYSYLNRFGSGDYADSDWSGNCTDSDSDGYWPDDEVDDRTYVADMAERDLVATENAYDDWQTLLALVLVLQPYTQAELRKNRKLQIVADKATRRSTRAWKNRRDERRVVAWARRARRRAYDSECGAHQLRVNINRLLVKTRLAMEYYFDLKAESDFSAKLAGYSPSDVVGM